MFLPSISAMPRHKLYSIIGTTKLQTRRHKSTIKKLLLSICVCCWIGSSLTLSATWTHVHLPSHIQLKEKEKHKCSFIMHKLRPPKQVSIKRTQLREQFKPCTTYKEYTNRIGRTCNSLIIKGLSTTNRYK